MTRFLVAFAMLVLISACASTPKRLSGHTLTLPADTTVMAERPDGTVLDAFTSALGLPCQRIAADQGNVVACQQQSGWLVVDDHAQGQSDRP